MKTDEKKPVSAGQTPISLRLPSDIAEKIDKMAADAGATRSAMLIKAISFYATAPRCIKCGAVNPASGVNCAVCGTPIYTDDEILWGLMSLGMKGSWFDCNLGFQFLEPINSLYDVARRYYVKYGWIGVRVATEYEIDKSKTPTEYRIKLSIISEDGSKIVPKGDNTLDGIFINAGIVVPQHVLIERLNFNREHLKDSLTYMEISDALKREYENKKEE